MTRRARVGVSVLLLVGAFFALHFRPASEGIALRRSFDVFPASLGGWTGRDDTVFDPEIIKILRMSDYLMRRYVDGSGQSAWLYLAYWQSQRRGADIHSPKNCLPGGGWEPVETSRISIPVAGAGGPITVNRYLIQKDRQMQVVLYWFQAQGKVVAGELEAKIEMMRNAILRNRTDGALVRISSPVHGTVPETTEALVRYVQLLYPVLRDYLPE
jgi:EpsI family protein